MKNTRKSIVMILIFSMILSVCTLFNNKVYAEGEQHTKSIVLRR